MPFTCLYCFLFKMNRQKQRQQVTFYPTSKRLSEGEKMNNSLYKLLHQLELVFRHELLVLLRKRFLLVMHFLVVNVGWYVVDT